MSWVFLVSFDLGPVPVAVLLGCYTRCLCRVHAQQILDKLNPKARLADGHEKPIDPQVQVRQIFAWLGFRGLGFAVFGFL